MHNVTIRDVRNEKGQFAKGRKHIPWNKGAKYPLSIRRKMSRSRKGKKLSLSHRRAISLGHHSKYKHAKWKGPRFKVARSICWKRAKGLCACCKLYVPIHKRHTHHVNWNTKDNLQKNLILLCGGCHTFYHRCFGQLINLPDHLCLYPQKMINQFLKKISETVGWFWFMKQLEAKPSA